MSLSLLLLLKAARSISSSSPISMPARPTVPVSLTTSLVIANLWIVGNVSTGQTSGEASPATRVGDVPAFFILVRRVRVEDVLVGLVALTKHIEHGLHTALVNVC